MHLRVNQLVKNFGDKEVLHGLSFDVKSGKALGLLGRNGAGKTTTIRIIMDLFESDAGTITLDGKPFKTTDYQIGYLPEERGLYPKKKVLHQLMYLGELRGYNKKRLKEQALIWLEKLDVLEYKDKKLETLSKGNQQKVQLASTFLCDPDIIILDEPFSGLDPVNSQILKEILRQLIADQKLIIFSSHQMTYIEEFCEEIALIEKGNLVLKGNLKDIKVGFGNDRLILSLIGQSARETKVLIEEKCSNLIEKVTIKKKKVIIQLKNRMTKGDFMRRLVEENLDIEIFSMYHPSLEDIFIEKVGESNE